MVVRAVTVDWSGYEPFSPGAYGPLHELPRSEARAAFNRVMSAKSQRIEALRQLLYVNHLDLNTSRDGIQRLNDWFVAEVEPDPIKAGRLRPRWYAVVNDIALFLGDVIIQRVPTVQWVFFTWGAKNLYYQRHVLMGFAWAKNPRYAIDIDSLVAMIGHRVVSGLVVSPHAFWDWIQLADEGPQSS